MDGDELDGGMIIAQITTGAGQGARCAQASHQVGDLPGGLFDNFWARGQVVRLPIGGVIVLVGIKVFLGPFGRHLPRYP